LRDLVIII